MSEQSTQPTSDTVSVVWVRGGCLVITTDPCGSWPALTSSSGVSSFASYHDSEMQWPWSCDHVAFSLQLTQEWDSDYLLT